MSLIQINKDLHHLVGLNDLHGQSPQVVFDWLKDKAKKSNLMKKSDRLCLLQAENPSEAGANFLCSDRPILGSSTKVQLGEGYGYMTKVMYAAAGNLSGFEARPRRTEACTKGCLSIKSGHLAFHFVGQILKLWAFKYNKVAFNQKVIRELETFAFTKRHDGYERALRMNGTTDLMFTEIWKAAQNLDIQCYEYTKIPRIVTKGDGVHRTFSISEDITSLIQGFEFVFEGETSSIIVPAKKKEYELATDWLTFYEIPWVDGDRHDLCFMDSGYLRVLKAKGLKNSEMIWDVDRLDWFTQTDEYRDGTYQEWIEQI